MTQNHKVCIIGAGSSGMVSAKILKENNIPFDCFEMSSDIGGNWRYNNDNGRSAAYDSLHIDTSKNRMAFSDFPMPDEYPNYPHHTQVFAYFQKYIDHFNLHPTITFHTQVTDVTPSANGGYQVTTRNQQTGATTHDHYRAVLVCNGHHWHPKIPQFPGLFNGRCFHAQQFRNANDLSGQNVLIVGIGNSGVDIAADAAHTANQVYLSTRRSAYIIPRYILGRATDNWITPIGSRLPFPVQRLLYRLLLTLAVGNQENYGVPRPNHPLLSEHPTMSPDLLNHVAHQRVIMKPNISHLAGDTIHFEDDSHAQIDTLIYATGYQLSFPFFKPDFIKVENNYLPLYHKVVHPDHEGLYFIGLMQPLGAIMPLAELQARWVAGLLTGVNQLPTPTTMKKTIAAEQVKTRQRYVNSPRHTMQVDFFPYQRRLQREIKNGRRR